MKIFKNNETIMALGTSFNGVKDMIIHAREKKPKNGVYVGEDSTLYPCFDSSDYVYEDRCYTNLVFAKSQEELDAKMNVLNNMKQTKGNYNKLTCELHPMAYWGGDVNNDVFMTETESE
jgi:hypothetical protein